MGAPASSAQRRRDAYWRRTRHLTAALLAVWFLSTFGIVFFARELSSIELFGWSLPFYMAAQGLIVGYLAIIALYSLCMRRIDRLLENETDDSQ
jgi:putative solute:sodium symporter small subunit